MSSCVLCFHVLCYVMLMLGRAKIPSISEDQDSSDWDLQDVTVDGETAGHERLRDIFKKDGKKAIFATIQTFVSELKAHQ